MKKSIVFKTNFKERHLSSRILRLPYQHILIGKYNGKDVMIEMKNLLINGIEGSGKSTVIQTILTSLLAKKPLDYRFILIDVNKDTFNLYEEIPYLACPVIHSVRLAIDALLWLNKEIDRRQALFSSLHISDYTLYKQLEIVHAVEPLPSLLLVIDECMELLDMYPMAYQECILKLAQSGKQVGIHMILASKSLKPVSGIFKILMPNRIIFKTKDITQREMFYLEEKSIRPLHCIPFDKDAIEAVNILVKQDKTLPYLITLEGLQEYEGNEKERHEDLLYRIAYFCLKDQKVNYNAIQNTFQIGFGYTNTLLKELDQKKIITKHEPFRSSEMLVNKETLQQIFHK